MSSIAKVNALTHLPNIMKSVGSSLIASILVVGSVQGEVEYKEVVVSNSSTVIGKAVYRGTPPGPYVIWVEKDTDVFGEKVPDERLIVSPAGRIKNVLVTVDGIKKGKPWPKHSQRLLNKGGRFVPHFQVVRTGSKLEIVNEDPTLHNTHAVLQGRTLFNLAQPLQGQVIRKRLKRQGLLEIMCDSHDWMNGWIAVLDHPYFAITGEDGSYKITGIPPGTYTLTAWHEKMGLQQVQVTLEAGKQQGVNFEFPLK